MRTEIYLNDKRITKKAAIEKYGKKSIEQKIQDAVEYCFEEPDSGGASWFMGGKDSDGDLTGYISHFATCPQADRHRRPR